MTDYEAGAYWERNAATWTYLSRQGWDVYRDLVNTPAFLDMLPDVAGRAALDIGCGEGHNTRLLARKGASVVGIDIAPTFVGHARRAETASPLGIRYAVASAQSLPFPDQTFDLAAAFMSLMDVPRPDAALREAYRVLRPAGFLQFSIMHPCFFPPYRKLLRDPNREARAVEVGRYFDNIDGYIDEWLFSATPAEVKAGLAPFRIPCFHRTLADWINAIVAAGFHIEEFREPKADDKAAARHPVVADTRLVAYFLHVRCRKT